MKILVHFVLGSILSSLVLAQSNPGWGLSSTPDPLVTEAYMDGFQERGAAGECDCRAPDGVAPDISPQESAESLSAAQPDTPSAFMLQSGGVGNEADEITPEIQSLAEGLRNDPLKIYEYVRNYIDYQCYYGSKKGAHLTLMEGSGNDMDQASLLIALLRAAGHTAGYTHGPAQFSFNEYVDWWGISPTPYTHMSNANFAAMLRFSVPVANSC